MSRTSRECYDGPTVRVEARTLRHQRLAALGVPINPSFHQRQFSVPTIVVDLLYAHQELLEERAGSDETPMTGWADETWDNVLAVVGFGPESVRDAVKRCQDETATIITARRLVESE